MEIDYFIDKLISKQRLNRFHDGNERKVVYFRIDKRYYLEYHPWNELGDLSIKYLLDKIHTKGELPNFLLNLLELEMTKELIQKNQFMNHDFGRVKENYAGQIVKIKFNNNYSLLKSYLTKGIRLRIDFNNQFQFDEFLEWFRQLDEKNKQQIDYLEDPGSNEKDLKKLKNLKLSLASDKNQFDSNIYHLKIYKPNIENFPHLNVPVIFSSYMGGDLGRYHAYLALMKFGDLNLVHGIDTPDIYEDQLFLFHSDGPKRELDESQVKLLYEKLEGLEWQPL